MKRNAKKELTAALIKELKACGLPDTEAAQNVFKALANGRAPKGIKNEIEAIQRGMAAAISFGLLKQAQRLKPRTDAELDKLLRDIQGMSLKLRPALGETYKNLQALAPQKKRGPQSFLTKTEKQSACNMIQANKNGGMTLKFAIHTVAQEYKITPRLMRKVWDNHGLR